MNLVILIGRIESKIDYKFMYKSKKSAKISFNLLLKNDSVVNIIAYDDIADKLYKTIQPHGVILICGKIDSQMQIEVKEFEKLFE